MSHTFNLSLVDPLDASHASQASKIMLGESTPPDNGRTFRVLGVPLDRDANDLETFLADHERSAGLVVRSLATEIHRSSQSATVTFQNVPHHLRAVSAGQPRSVLLPKSSVNQHSRL
jgi:hypothetical protein